MKNKMKNADENAPETHRFNDLGRRKTQTPR